jgi:hypothetical protein
MKITITLIILAVSLSGCVSQSKRGRANEHKEEVKPAESNLAPKGVRGLSDVVNLKIPEERREKGIAEMKLSLENYRSKLASDPESKNYCSILMQLSIAEYNYRRWAGIREPWVEAIPSYWFVLNNEVASDTDKMIAIRGLSSHLIEYNYFPVSENLTRRIISEFDKSALAKSSMDKVRRAKFLSIIDRPKAISELENYADDKDRMAAYHAKLYLKEIKQMELQQ